MNNRDRIADGIHPDHLERRDDLIRTSDLAPLHRELLGAKPRGADAEIIEEIWSIIHQASDGGILTLANLDWVEGNLHRLEDQELRDRLLAEFADLHEWMTR